VEYFDLIEKKFYVAPRGSLSYDVSDLTTISASAGVYYQTPSYIWLVANAANRSLTDPRANQYILGVEHLLQSDVKVRVEGYLKDYRDYPASVDQRYLVLSNTGAGYGGTEDNFSAFGLDVLSNGGIGRSYGLEFLVQKKLSETPLYGIVSLTLSKARFTALDGIERTGGYNQSVLLSVSGGYRLDERWEFSAKFRYSSGRPYTPFNADGTQNVALYNSATTKPLHGLDVRVDRRWNFSAWSLITYLDIQNIYNNKNTGAVRWNARTRMVEENDSSIGVLPSIGVSAEF
jgi:hypothetical protein